MASTSRLVFDLPGQRPCPSHLPRLPHLADGAIQPFDLVPSSPFLPIPSPSPRVLSFLPLFLLLGLSSSQLCPHLHALLTSSYPTPSTPSTMPRPVPKCLLCSLPCHHSSSKVASLSVACNKPSALKSFQPWWHRRMARCSGASAWNGPSDADSPEDSSGPVYLHCPCPLLPQGRGDGAAIRPWTELTTRAVGCDICQMSQLIAKFVLSDKW